MAKFTRTTTQSTPRSSLRTLRLHRPTYEGGLGYQRDPKSSLFLLAVSNMVREDTFYEVAGERDARYVALIHQIAREDPEWVAGFVPYLRNTMLLRSASVVMAAEYVRADAPRGRQVVASALQRADEPAEILAYWMQAYGRRLPQPLKRGVADAVRRLYTERTALKYDGTNADWRMGDVLDLCHPRPASAEQSALFRWLLDRRHDRATAPESLPLIRTLMQLEALPVEARRALLKDPAVLAAGGITWERLSGWLQGAMDAEAWEAIVPSMGYMALLRNLRNLERAGVSAAVLDTVATKLADPAEVAASRQLPLRFYAAFKNLASERFGWVLEQALEASLANIPATAGRTLILVDVSGSMRDVLSRRSSVLRGEVAALFGAALARRCGSADLHAYSNAVQRVGLTGSILRTVEACGSWPGAWQGTCTFQALEATYRSHDRVVLLTDEQAHPYQPSGGEAHILQRISCPIYTFNLAGYDPAGMEQGAGGRYVFGGLTDAGFRMIPLLEDRREGRWPWQEAKA
jgi:hypothetical protein